MILQQMQLAEKIILQPNIRTETILAYDGLGMANPFSNSEKDLIKPESGIHLRRTFVDKAQAHKT